MEACNKRGEWGGYAGGDAPGLKFESCYWLQEKQVAGVCSDTWGVEVRPNETKDVNQPWHWVVIPAMGLYMGEMFDLKELAEDCARDKVYEFFFCGAPLDHSRRHRLADQSPGHQVEDSAPHEARLLHHADPSAGQGLAALACGRTARPSSWPTSWASSRATSAST